MSVPAGEPVEGEVIGPYRILRELGGGGMGVVYEAADDALDRKVALKVISPHLADDAHFRARFTREARALAALDSPQVVQVYAHGEADGRLYLATQLVPDGDLGTLLRLSGAPPLRVALDLVAQVAAGLAAAHGAGLVHRDIKPGNVLLRRRGTTLSAYLGDFGIARRLDGVATHARTGAVGTPAYMAPELHTGGGAGVASDVYSLGCLLWTASSGHAPYRGTTDYQVARAHLEQPVPQLPGRSALVVAVNRILRTAMAKDPADRYATAAELGDDLRRATDLAAGGHRRRAVAALVGLGVLLVGAVGWGIARGHDGAVTRAAQPSPSATPDPPDPSAVQDTLADALARQGSFTRVQAECAAAQWIANAGGVEAMVAEGLVDASSAFVDVPVAELSPAMRSAAAAATATCTTP